VHLSTPGGLLAVSFEQQPDGSFTNVWLSGPAVRVFQGSI
jgi:diaminopimelate epimerase